ncbi:hypothetical protein [Nocardia abscessus]|uniref:hypothetical protein n=1 Tax=Nocardia abscessus TaxID=120957 RepID=UPI002458897A|nr:hypothetical protein [Nocardia abscessus]
MSFKIGDKAIVTGPRRMATDRDDYDGDWGISPGSVVEIAEEIDEDGDVYVRGENGFHYWIAPSSLTLVEPEDEIVVDMTFPDGTEIKVRVTGFAEPHQALIALKRAGSDDTLAGLAAVLEEALED